jgi:hypothetical protein
VWLQIISLENIHYIKFHIIYEISQNLGNEFTYPKIKEAPTLAQW